MNPESIAYRGHVITWFPARPDLGYRVDRHYETLTTCTTLQGAKGQATRNHKRIFCRG